MDKNELIHKIQKLEGLTNDERSELLGLLREQKKYGLVWENNPEELEEELRFNIPALKESKEKAIISDAKNAPNHILIEGDNLDALNTLFYTHQGKVDTIYIDPPYNTGAKNWKYNNDYVDKEDGFRHSKFISFLYKRLQIAKKLLSESGIIICAIDDYEIHNVRLLMDEIFGENNRLGTIVVVHNPRGRNDDSFIATMHEYLLVYALNAANASIGYFEISEEDAQKEFNKKDEISAYAETSFIRTGNNSLRVERPGLWYPIYYNPNVDKLSLKPSTPNDILLFPINGKNEERCWRWSPETFLQKKDTELFVKKVKGEYKIYKKRRITEMLGRKPKTVWSDSKYDASSNGIMLLQDIFNGKNPFPYPKSLYAVYDILQISTKPDSTILDFFAGSGTTLHATMLLNSNDGGHRQCILVTNNENKICEEVTYERNKRVICGYKNSKGENISGLKNNSLRYYKINHILRESSRLNDNNLARNLIDAIKISNNAYKEELYLGQIKMKPEYIRYYRNECLNVLIIFEPQIIPVIVSEIEKITDEKFKIYIKVEGDYAFAEEFESIINRVELIPIPYAYKKALHRTLPDKDKANEIIENSNDLSTDNQLNLEL